VRVCVRVCVCTEVWRITHAWDVRETEGKGRLPLCTPPHCHFSDQLPSPKSPATNSYNISEAFFTQCQRLRPQAHHCDVCHESLSVGNNSLLCLCSGFIPFGEVLWLLCWDNRVIYYLPNAAGTQQINFNETIDCKCRQQSGSSSNQQNMLF
jgi:hypothetical protein